MNASYQHITISKKRLFTFYASALIFLTSALLLYFLGVTTSNDVNEYKDLWNRLQNVGFMDAVSIERFEVGSLLLYWSLSQLLSASATFYTVGFTAMSVKYYLFKKHLHYPLFAWFIYITIFIHVLDTNQIRASLAVCFILYALISENHGKSYLILAVIASFFHYSGLIIVLLYFVRAPLIGVVSVTLLILFFDSIITYTDKLSFLQMFLSSPGQVNLTNSNFIVQACISIICAFKWKSLSEAQKKGAYLIMMGVIFYILFYNNAIMAHRLRELSLIGIFPLLFLGERKLEYSFIIIWLCVGYIVAYSIWIVMTEFLHLYLVV